MSDTSEPARKRKLSRDIDTFTNEPNAKQKLIVKNESNIGENHPRRSKKSVNLLDLSDEMLLLILLQLDGNSLLSLSLTCSRMQILTADKTLWTVVDYSTARLKTEDVLYRANQLKLITKTLKLRGMTSFYPAKQWKTPTLTSAILKTIYTRCLYIEQLELTEAYWDSNEISIIMFPQTLRSLIFRKCSLSLQNTNDNSIYLLQQPHTNSFLSNIYKHLVRLEELTIEYCTWFDTHDFMVLSKLPNLRYLSLKGCTNIKDSVPYASLATRFGFKKLAVLDLRDTPISDSDVSCFNIVRSLKELLLECPDHLRTESGLLEYNETERIRVEQLHRLVALDLQHNGGEMGPNGNQEAPRVQGVVDPLPEAAAGLQPFEIIVINGRQPGNVEANPENFIRIGRGREDALVQNMPNYPPANVARRVIAYPPPIIPRAAPDFIGVPAIQDMPPENVEPVPIAPNLRDRIENNNNNVDRQHIVRIINRDFLQQRRELGLQYPHRLLARPNRVQLHAAFQNIFEADRQHAPEIPQPDIAAGAAPGIEHDLENPRINGMHLGFHGIRVANEDQNNDAQYMQQQGPRQNNPPPNRILPHVIILPEIGNIPAIQRQANANYHQVYVNLGLGQQAPNYVSLVSDRGICAYGVSRNELGGSLMGRLLHQNVTGLERLLLRNYKLITDTSLHHLESAAPNLKLLDVTGTSVTAEGVRCFRLSRPGCVIVSDHDKRNDLIPNTEADFKN